VSFKKCVQCGSKVKIAHKVCWKCQGRTFQQSPPRLPAGGPPAQMLAPVGGASMEASAPPKEVSDAERAAAWQKAKNRLEAGDVRGFMGILRAVPSIARFRSEHVQYPGLLHVALVRHAPPDADLTAAITALIEAGAGVNDRADDERGDFPLMIVCNHSRHLKDAASLAGLLLRAGARIDMPELVATGGHSRRRGATPLYVACFHRNAALMELLVSHGASLHAPNPDSDGQTPLEMARIMGVLEHLVREPKQTAGSLRVSLRPLHLASKYRGVHSGANYQEMPLDPDVSVEYQFHDSHGGPRNSLGGRGPVQSGVLAGIRGAKSQKTYALEPALVVPRAQDGLSCSVSIDVVVKHGKIRDGDEGSDRETLRWSARSLDFMPPTVLVPLRANPNGDLPGGHLFAVDLTVEILPAAGGPTAA
jgi:hypothetical protein